MKFIVQPYDKYVNRFIEDEELPACANLHDKMEDTVDDLVQWFQRGRFARAYAVGQTVYVLKGHEDDDKLLAHEYGHVIGLEHPGHPGNKFTQTFSAIKDGLPVMSWTGALRWTDKEGLVAAYKMADKEFVYE